MNPSPSRHARVLAQSLLAIACGAIACSSDDDASGKNGSQTSLGGSAGSGGGSAGSGGGSAGSGGGSFGPHPCVDPRPILLAGAPTGMVACADTSRERVTPGTCSLSPKAQTPICPDNGTAGAAGAGAGGAATECAEACPDGKYGRKTGIAPQAFPNRFCEYFCETDADCPTGRACACGDDGVGQCLVAECASTADCAGDATCRKVVDQQSCVTTFNLLCIDAADQCVVANECRGSGQNACVRNPAGDTACQGTGGCGRPILVEAIARVALLVRSAVWV